ncbi:MAG: protein translocase subunit SecF [Actinobacteria bacterium]|nr:protein translocase subunit SecF [Actinomycetota bacterium]MBW3649533.1 protein translocase subunit SecF [Actinomycetota bacterium]
MSNAGRRSLWQRLYHGETAFDFVGPIRRWLTISGLVIVVGLLSLATRGLNFGIDFRGGTAWEVPTSDPSVERARDALRPLGLDDAEIQVLGKNILRVQADAEGASPEQRKARQEEVARALAESEGVEPSLVSVNEVGPSWGNEITKKARNALAAFLVVITIYISFRFEPKMAVASLAALAHDILVTVGVYSLSGFEVTPSTVVAFLTILGYSLYDTIVVFDKVDENTKGLAASGRMTYTDVVNLSMNQVLMRSLNTSLVAILPIFSVLVVGSFILGATTLQDFGLALLVGLLTGAYSSLFIASPVLAILKEREPRYASIRQRLENRPGSGGPLTPAAAAAGGATVGGESRDQVPAAVGAAAGRSASSRPATNRGTPPRPRKKGRRR